jgi:DNA-binding NarL/FixJ family response regulator
MHILIVDDHPLNVDSYVALLSQIESNKNASFHLAYNCKQAYDLITQLDRNEINIDMAFIDLSLPAYEELNFRSGDEIGSLVQQKFPNCIIIIISMHSEPVRVNQIIKTLNPQGFISKNDINYKNFPAIMDAISKKDSYFSKTIMEAQKEFIIKNINWDEHDSKMVRLIAEGIKTKDLPHYIPLSLSALEKRKANLKKQFLFEGGSDGELIEQVKKLGLFNNIRK